MIPVKIDGFTRELGKPEGWDEAGLGECVTLAVKIEDGNYLSAWEPTPDELAALNAGGKVILRVAGCQPPVMLWVEPSKSEIEEMDALEDNAFRNGTIAEYVLLRKMNMQYVTLTRQGLRLERTAAGKDCYDAVKKVTGGTLWMGAPVFLDEALAPDYAILTFKDDE